MRGPPQREPPLEPGWIPRCRTLIWNRLIQCSSTHLILVRRTQVHFCGVVVLALLIFDEGAVPLGSHLAELARRAETARRGKTAVRVPHRKSAGVGGIPHLACPIEGTERIARCRPHAARGAGCRVGGLKGD